MRIHTILLMLLIGGGILNADAQRVARYTSPSGSVYPDVSVNNMITMLSMNLVDWERNMKLISKVRDDFAELGIQYTIDGKTGTSDGYFCATKKETVFEVAYQKGANGESVFTDFMKELKTFYVKDLDGFQIYQYKHTNDVEYIFVVKQDGLEEYARIYINQ